MIEEQRICYLFNKFFSSFIKELKGLDDGLKTTIKKNYKVIDKSSDEYYTLFWDNVKSHLDVFVASENDMLSMDEDILKLEIIQGITIGDAVEVLKEHDLQTFWNYINILLIFAYLYTDIKSVDSITKQDGDGDVEQVKESDAKANTYLLFTKVVTILSLIQNSQDTSSELEDIIDDDVKRLLLKIKVFENTTEEVNLEEEAKKVPTPSTEFLQSIENSKIADLAKEISKEIDISNINIEKPEDVAKLMDFSGSNNFLGNIVSKVSNKLTEKISSGEIKQEDLLSEAMSMMSMLNGGGGGGVADILKGMGGMGGLGEMLNNPMMSEIMKMAKKGKVSTKNTNGTRRTKANQSNSAPISTRDRLRKKLEEKKKMEQGDDKS